MDARFDRPDYQTGAQFLNVTIPNRNALTSTLTGDYPATIYGTDPAWFAAATLASTPQEQQVASVLPSLPSVDFGKIGRIVAFGVLALLLISLGLWVIVKQ